MDDKFYELLELLEKSTATEKQRKEFFRLINTDEYNHIIAEDWLEALRKKHQPSLEGSREKIYNRIYSENIAPEEAAHERSMWSRRWLIAAAASIALVFVSGVILYRQNSENRLAAAEENVLTFTGKNFIHLPDGSTATLNEGSELKYRATENGREVFLSGEAYFDVAHNPLIPFKVHTGKVVTTVLGTAFNVNASDGNKITVTVTRGKVAVGDETDHSYGTITPNERLAVNTSTNEVIRSQVDPQNAVEWKSKYFIVDHVTFEEAIAQVEKRYHVSVSITNEALKPCIVSAWFLNNENLKQIVDGLSAVQQATVIMNGDKIVIEGGTGCKSE